MEDRARSTINPPASAVPQKSIPIHPSHLATLKGDAPPDLDNEKPIFVFEAVGNADVALARLASSADFWKQSPMWTCTNPSSPQQPQQQSQRPGKSKLPVCTVLERIRDKLYVLHYQFEVTFGFYVMEPWEKVAYYAFFLAFTSAVLMLVYYLPTWTIRAIRRLVWYLTGDSYGASCDGCLTPKSALRTVAGMLNSSRMHAALQAQETVSREAPEGWTYITQAVGETLTGQTPALLNCICSPLASR